MVFCNFVGLLTSILSEVSTGTNNLLQFIDLISLSDHFVC